MTVPSLPELSKQGAPGLKILLAALSARVHKATKHTVTPYQASEFSVPAPPELEGRRKMLQLGQLFGAECTME